MSRAVTGKSSRLTIFFRFQLLYSVMYLPAAWLFDAAAFRIELGRWSSHLLLAEVWFGSGCVFYAWMTIWMRRSFDLMFGGRDAYRNWLANGGDPFSDWLPSPINSDPKVVRMAIGTPPPFDSCPE